MDSVRTISHYGTVNELEQADFRRKARKRKVIISISAVLLALIIGVVAGTFYHNKQTKNSDESPSSAVSSFVRLMCSDTLYPSSCIWSLGSSSSSNPHKIFELSLVVALRSLENISTFPGEYAARTDDPRVKDALTVCGAELNDAVEHLNESISAASGGGRISDLKTWLSTAITDLGTCNDALIEADAPFSDEVKLLMRNSTELASNSLAIVSRIIKAIDIPIHRRRRMLGVFSELGVPSWVNRNLLQEAARPNVVVASDGSGDVRTVGEAVARMPKKSNARFVIYVKAGVYVENVVVNNSYWNLMIYGDGKYATVISGSKNYVDHTGTFNSATFAVTGRGFIAIDIGFRNTAGPAKLQAVALRSGSDQSVFYRCSFDAFQDTLYAHSNRQFYRECDIAGTIDFIFGNAAAVFQNCSILPRQPLPYQYVTITSQGKIDPNQNTGISIQSCTMSPLDRLTTAAYLGRPWKNYSTTVIMTTSIGGFLSPSGWISFPNVDPPRSLSYSEYGNTGPGANTAGRVSWPGYNPAMTVAQAVKYNVGSFIAGGSWLPATSVAFDLN